LKKLSHPEGVPENEVVIKGFCHPFGVKMMLDVSMTGGGAALTAG